mgnify:CR=1 FL=1|tara:strand:+ start:585 stop:980 length:396 start_codon:yes stop_codon:yes gene_type:complete
MLLPNIPLDSKSGDSRLLCENVTADLLKNWLGWGVGIELLRIIFIVDVVSDTNKLSAIVGAGKEDNGDTKNFGIWNATGIGWVGLEKELVYANWNGTNEEGVEFLVVLITGIVRRLFVLGVWNAHEVADPT